MAEIKVDGERLSQLIGTISSNTQSLEDLKEETKTENEKRDKRIRWSRIVSCIAVLVGVIGITVGAIGWNSARQANEAIRQAKVALVVATQVREDARISTCAGFEAFTNALIAISPPSANPAAQATQQAQIDAFKTDLEGRLSGLHCTLNLLPAK